MSDGFRRWSYSTADGLAYSTPSHSTVTIRELLYKEREHLIPFRYFGVLEELGHGAQTRIGLSRTIHRLDQESKSILTELLDGQQSIKKAKQHIVQNHLACADLHSQSQHLVEVLDQYTVQAGRRNAIGQSDSQNSTDYSKLLTAEAVGSKQLKNRGTSASKEYKDLIRLEDRFGTWVVPTFAGLLALDITEISMDAPPKARTECLSKIDVQDRFDIIVSTLMDSTDPNPTVASADIDWEGEFGSEFTKFFFQFLDTLPFEASMPLLPDNPLPLLDLPRRNSPSEKEIQQRTVVDTDSHVPPFLRTLLSDAALFFSRYACVILGPGGTVPDLYLPNPYVTDEQIGSSPYFQEFYTHIVACHAIDQLLKQSVTNTASALHCPFCKTVHDHQGGCTNPPIHSRPEMVDANRNGWNRYLEPPPTFINEFASTEVPGEEHLAAYHSNNQAAN